MGSPMLIFDDLSRTDTGPAAFAEGSFAYYNRSARPEVGSVRDLLEQWIAAYPDQGRQDLIHRLREDFGSFQAAFFELYLHALFLALGHRVELHPELDGTTKRPDFLVAPSSGGGQFYVEAVVAGDESVDQRTERRLHDRIQDDINAFRHQGFFFILARLDGRPAEYPRRRMLHEFLRVTLEGLDPDEVERRIRSGESISRTLRRRFSHKGLQLELYPWPKSPAARGDEHYRSVGAGPVRVPRSTAREAIRAAVKGKAGRYGELCLPYIVAVNCASRWGVEEDEVREALLGREELRIPRGGEPRFVYDGEGAFTHKHAPVNTRVSGVLAFRDLAPPSVLRAEIRLYHHIAPKRPYVGPLDVLPSARRVGDVLKYLPGTVQTPQVIFGLYPEWPYESDHPRVVG